MPARDTYHPHVVDALVADGWTITHDPLPLRVGGRDLFVDLGAERFVAAERGAERIAVEIKSFRGPSDVRELEVAVGQFVLYSDALARTEPERTLFLAIRDEVYTDIFEEPLGKMLLDNRRVRLVVVNSTTRKVTRWIP